MSRCCGAPFGDGAQVAGPTVARRGTDGAADRRDGGETATSGGGTTSWIDWNDITPRHEPNLCVCTNVRAATGGCTPIRPRCGPGETWVRSKEIHDHRHESTTPRPLAPTTARSPEAERLVLEAPIATSAPGAAVGRHDARRAGARLARSRARRRSRHPPRNGSTAASAIKGLDSDAAAVGEEWMSGPYPCSSLRNTRRTACRPWPSRRSPVAGIRVRHGARPARHRPGAPAQRLRVDPVARLPAEVWMPPGVPHRRCARRAGLGAGAPR